MLLHHLHPMDIRRQITPISFGLSNYIHPIPPCKTSESCETVVFLLLFLDVFVLSLWISTTNKRLAKQKLWNSLVSIVSIKHLRSSAMCSSSNEACCVFMIKTVSFVRSHCTVKSLAAGRLLSEEREREQKEKKGQLSPHFDTVFTWSLQWRDANLCSLSPPPLSQVERKRETNSIVEQANICSIARVQLKKKMMMFFCYSQTSSCNFRRSGCIALFLRWTRTYRNYKSEDLLLPLVGRRFRN